ncbi:MAG: glycosyltransferase family 2 protein [Clostridia bacterium]|nr:glycosyltransferase family 2 protein [Clostridia bacterium]
MKRILIIPAYNEQDSIIKTIEKIKESNINMDYIVINDGSTDGTESLLVENNVNHIRLISNLGIGGAVQTGYKYAFENGYDIAIQFDGDGQHDVRFIDKICEPIVLKEADMVIGTRYLDKSSSSFQSTFMRRFGSNLISFMIKICCRKKITDPTSGFRAVNKRVLEEFALDYPTEYPEPESTVSLLVNKYVVKEVPVSMNERNGGTSSIRLWKSVDYMGKVLLSILVDSISFRKKRRKK